MNSIGPILQPPKTQGAYSIEDTTLCPLKVKQEGEATELYAKSEEVSKFTADGVHSLPPFNEIKDK